MPTDTLNCLYITSVFPCLSETFVLREMQALHSLGWNISVFRIRGAEKITIGKSSFLLLPIMLRPVYWFRGFLWVSRSRKRYTKFCEISKELFSVNANILARLKLVLLLFTVLGMAEYIDGHRISITHIRAHFLHNETLGAYWLSKILNLPYSITIHTRMIYYPQPLLQKTVQNASFCVGISGETVELARKLRSKQDGVFLIRNGINFDVLQNNIQTVKSNNIPTILAVGRLIPKKGFDVLIKACSLLKESRVDFVCRIIGDGTEFTHLKKLIRDNDLIEQVCLLGALSFEHVVDEYRKATLLIMPSRVCKDDVDGLPTVIIEALALGIPVIASSVAGIPDLIKDRETGLIVPPEDEKSLANAIQNVLFDKELYNSLAFQGKKEVLKNFDISETIKQLNDVILLSSIKHKV